MEDRAEDLVSRLKYKTVSAPRVLPNPWYPCYLWLEIFLFENRQTLFFVRRWLR
jgi:hypothetical protein